MLTSVRSIGMSPVGVHGITVDQAIQSTETKSTIGSGEISEREQIGGLRA